MFDVLPTGIDGLDALLSGGIRFPSESAAFVFVTGQAGTGKTLLGLEILTRAWWNDDQGGRSFLFYSVEQSPEDLYKKLDYDFGHYFGCPRTVERVESEAPHKLCLDVAARSGGVNRLVITQANPALIGTMTDSKSFRVDIDWIKTEVSNYLRAQAIGMVALDNVGLLLNDLEYFDKRAALVRTRKELMRHNIHSIFILEEGMGTDRHFPSPEELSTDILIQLSFKDIGEFKSRTIEIVKARHQYYYRGVHQFSIAGRGINRALYLGARGERGPGVHIYPSVAAQLSITRDESQLKVPARGEVAIPFLSSAFHGAFHKDDGPCRLSSTILLAEPATRYTSFALRFLAEGVRNKEAGLLVSTNEDEDAVRRICKKRDTLAALRGSGAKSAKPFSEMFRLLYLHPEFLSAGKFTSDILRMLRSGDDAAAEPRISRLAFDNVFQLHRRFPLLEGQDFLIPALLDLLRYNEVTPLFIDLVPVGKGDGELGMDPSLYLSTFDNVFHLFLHEVDGKVRPHMRIYKSMGNEYTRRAFELDF